MAFLTIYPPKNSSSFSKFIKSINWEAFNNEEPPPGTMPNFNEFLTELRPSIIRSWLWFFSISLCPPMYIKPYLFLILWILNLIISLWSLLPSSNFSSNSLNLLMILVLCLRDWCGVPKKWVLSLLDSICDAFPRSSKEKLLKSPSVSN